MELASALRYLSPHLHMLSHATNQKRDARWWPDGEASKLLASRQFVVPVVGSGLSGAAGLLAGRDLANWMRSLPWVQIARWNDPHNCFAVADQIAALGEAAALRLRSNVAERLDAAAGRTRITPALQSLVTVPSRLIITLNYDLLIERAAALAGVEYVSFAAPDFEPGYAALRSLGDGVLRICHLHGSVASPEKLVLDNSSYRRHITDRGVQMFVDAVLKLATACFVGVSLDEPYLISEFQSTSSGAPRHVFIGDAPTIEAATAGRSAITAERHGVVAAGFPAGRWECLDQFLARLCEPNTVQGQAPAASQSATPKFYVEQTLTVRSATQEVEGLLGEMEGHPAANPRGWRFSERTVALGARTLIVGDAGVGKTSFLQAVRDLVPPPEAGVYVRLATAGAVAGEAASVLKAWLEREHAATGRVNLDNDLQKGRLHLLLDGLDEVPPDRQAATAAAIRSVAEAFPQHRFTVTTRPVKAVMQLPSVGWLHLTLEATGSWRNRYLAARGASWNQLAAGIPGVNVALALSTLPFFLARLLDLVDDTEAKPSDALELVEYLLDAALAREQRTLPASADAVRPWLTSIAINLRLPGLTRVKPSPLRSTQGGRGVNWVGDEEDLIELLVQRLLITTHEKEVSFTDSCFADALAARYLLLSGPSEAVLDAVVPDTTLMAAGPAHDDPSVRHSAVQRTGPRSDCGQLLAFVASRSDAWRSALRTRAPLFADLVTPRTARPDERNSAVRRLLESDPVEVTRLERLLPAWHPDTFETIVRLGEGDEESVRAQVEPLLLSVPEDETYRVTRAWAVIARIGAPNVLDLLAPSLQSPDELVVMAAATAAMELNATAAVDQLQARIADLYPPYAAHVMSCAATLAPTRALEFVSTAATTHGVPALGEDLWSVYGLIRRYGSPEDNRRFLRGILQLEGGPAAYQAFAREYRFAAGHGAMRILEPPEPAEAGLIQRLTDLLQPGAPTQVAEPSNPQNNTGAGELGERQSVTFQRRALRAEVLEERSRLKTGVLVDVDPNLPVHWIPPDFLESLQARTESPSPAPPGLEDSAETPHSRLGDLLLVDSAETDAALLANRSVWSEAAWTLLPAQRSELTRRLDRIMPVQQVVDGPGGKAARDRALAIWLDYGPPLNPELSPEAWVAIATAAPRAAARIVWLTRTWTPNVIPLLKASRVQKVSRWSAVFLAFPRDELFEEGRWLVSKPSRMDDAESLIDLGDYLALRRHDDALRALAAQGPAFSHVLRQSLAAICDVNAIRELLEEVPFFGEKLPDPLPDLSWIKAALHNGVELPSELLPFAFKALLNTANIPDESSLIARLIRTSPKPIAAGLYRAVVDSSPTFAYLLGTYYEDLLWAWLDDYGRRAGAALVRDRGWPPDDQTRSENAVA